MLLLSKKSILTLCAIFCTLVFQNANAATLTLSKRSPVLNPDSQNELPIIVYFDSKLDVASLRREINRSLQGKNLSRKEYRRQFRKNSRLSMLNRLHENLLEPQTVMHNFLASYGIKRKIKKLWGINALALSVPSDLLSQVQRLPGVERVSVDLKFTLSEDTTEVTSGIPLWNLYEIKAPELWQLGLTGEGIVVGVMDSGVDLNHPDLYERWRAGGNSWFDPYGVHASPIDLIGHGTQATGIILGSDNSGYQVGVAPRAKWIAAKIFDDAGEADLSKIHEAFQWMMDPDNDPTTDDAPDIVNNSWGITSHVNSCISDFSEDLTRLREAGIAVVFSAGNFGPLPETSLSPANESSVDLSIGSTNQNTEVTFSSSRGPGACDGTIYPKLVAPGDSIFTTDKLPNGYNIVSGTSYAAPHVSGAVAQLMSAPFAATVSQIESALRETAVDIDLVGPDNNAGYGLIDVASAYEWLLNDFDIADAGIILFSDEAYSVDENTGKIQITVRRIGGSSGEVSVDYQTFDGSALGFASADYLKTNGTLTFLEGETSHSLEITINDDSLDEQNEDFIIELSNPTGGALLGSRISAPVVILDDDGPGTLTLEASNYAISENSTGFDISILRTGGYEGTVSVAYATVDETASSLSDYIALDGEVSFADGERSKNITIEIVNDDDYESNETFRFMLSNPLGGADISEIDTANIVILNDDVDPLQTVVQLESSNFAFLENSDVIQIAVQRLGDPSKSVSVEYVTTSGSAKEGEDFESTTGTISFNSGQLTETKYIDIKVLDDRSYEGTETFNVTLFNATNGAILGNPTASVISIRDNDAIPAVSLSSGSSAFSNSSLTHADSDTMEQTESSTSSEASTDTKNDGSLQIHDLTLSDYSGIVDNAVTDQQVENVTQPDNAESDKDGDGFPSSVDCNDQDPSIHPGAAEVTGDMIDQDCNGSDLKGSQDSIEKTPRQAKQ